MHHRYNKPVTALAILAMISPDKSPGAIMTSLWTPRNSISFIPTKIWEQDEVTLSQKTNPFALEVLKLLMAMKNRKTKHDDLLKFFVAQAYAESTWNMSHVGDADRGANASQGALQFSLGVQDDAGRFIADDNGNKIGKGKMKAADSPQDARNAMRASMAHFLQLFNNPYGGTPRTIFSTLASYQSGDGVSPREDFNHYLSNIENAL